VEDLSFRFTRLVDLVHRLTLQKQHTVSATGSVLDLMCKCQEAYPFR